MSNSLNQNFKTLSLLKFALPSMIMMVFMSLYTIIDGIFVSRLVGESALSAVNIVWPVICILIAIGVMLATGGSAVVARKMGEGDEKGACENFTFLAVVGVAVSLVLLVIVLLFHKPIVYALGADDSLFENGKTYLIDMMYFGPCCILQSLFQCFFATAGKPAYGLGLITAGGVVNAILDYVFMGPMQLGIAGAAIATGIGQMIPAVVGVIYFLVKRKGLHFTRFHWDGKALWQSCTNGSSEMVTNLSNAVITYLFNIILMRMVGADGVAAITIILYGQFLFNALYLGFSMGVAPVISFQYGAKNSEKLSNVYHISNRFAKISSGFMAVASILLAKPITSVFVSESSHTFAMTVTGFALFGINYLFSGYNVFTSSLFTALSDGKTSALVSFSRTFVCILASLLILPQIIGLKGVWLAVPVAEFVTSGLSFYCQRRNLSKYGI